jgi:hypothetical protein
MLHDSPAQFLPGETSAQRKIQFVLPMQLAQSMHCAILRLPIQAIFGCIDSLWARNFIEDARLDKEESK